jgi:hypothetical protein
MPCSIRVLRYESQGHRPHGCPAVHVRPQLLERRSFDTVTSPVDVHRLSSLVVVRQAGGKGAIHENVGHRRSCPRLVKYVSNRFSDVLAGAVLVEHHWRW